MTTNAGTGARDRRGRIAITGSTGLVGSALIPALQADGYEVVRIVRSRPAPGEVRWDPARGEIDAAGLEGVNAVINLAGENLGQRWTGPVKDRIRQSRVQGTRLLAETLASLRDRPDVLISASGVGFYGDCGDEPLTEAHPAGKDFLGRLGQEWEDATLPASDVGVRVAHTRFGVALSRRGGALARLLPPFHLGVGGKLGSGRQWFSWISLVDLVEVVRFILRTPGMSGPINTVAPEPVTNAEFTRTLGRVLGRPTLFTVPKVALELVYGEMAQATLFASQRAIPERLVNAGFQFRHPHLREALEAALRTG